MSIENFADIAMDTAQAGEILDEVSARLRRAASLGEAVDLNALADLLDILDIEVDC